MTELQKINFVRKFQYMLNIFCVTRVENLELLQQMYGSLTILPPSCFVYSNKFSKTNRKKLHIFFDKFAKLL